MGRGGVVAAGLAAGALALGRDRSADEASRVAGAQGRAPRRRSNSVLVKTSLIRSWLRALLDAGAKALALFALANLLLALFSARWDATWLWVQGGALPTGLVHCLAILFAVGVFFLRGRHPLLDLFVRGVALLLGVACLADAFVFYRLLAVGRITSSLPIPLSLFLAALLVGWAVVARPDPWRAGGGTRRALWVQVLDRTAPLWLAGVGLVLHLVLFGATSYARPADAAVVFGAAVRANGEPSQVLRDRTLTACALYERGLVGRLVLSGGRNPTMPLSEPQCMANIALAAGVPASALIFDEAGRNTEASIESVRRLAEVHGWGSVLMVSHDYHLARIQMTSRKAGLRVFTVPAVEPKRLLSKPWFTLRETAAWAAYFIRP